jgi:hypothetical protein
MTKSNKIGIAIAAVMAAMPVTSAMGQVGPMYGNGRAQCSDLPNSYFLPEHRVGQWVMGYVAGALNMNISATGDREEVNARAADWRAGDDG